MSAATLATRVKARREELGLPQSKLPGLDQSTLSKIESGKMKDPGLDVLAKLSKGLGLTLDELNGAPASAVRMVELRDIAPDPNNPRTIGAGADDQALVDSIKALGLLQPLAVRNLPVASPTDRPSSWMVVDGHRRYAALVQLHGPKSKTLVPVHLVEADDTATLLMQLVANVQRADMNPLDLAEGVGKLVVGGMDTQAIADALGRKRRWVQEQASVHRYLTTDGKEALGKGIINISQAVALAAERDEEKQNNLMARVGMQGLGEDDIRALIADSKATAGAADDRQLALIGGEDDAEAEDPAEAEIERQRPKPVGGWKTWRNPNGYFKWQLLKTPDAETFVVETQVQWRRDGSVHAGWGTVGRDPKPTAAEALAIAVVGSWHEYEMFGAKKDLATFTTSLIPWINKGLGNLGADDALRTRVFEKLQARIVAKLDPPLDRPMPPRAAPATPKRPPPITRKDVEKVPSWAGRMKLSYFVVMEGGKATLVRSWKSLAGIMFGMYGEDDNDTVRSMMDRKQWSDDPAGAPFDFSGIVYRITDMKVRGPR